MSSNYHPILYSVDKQHTLTKNKGNTPEMNLQKNKLGFYMLLQCIFVSNKNRNINLILKQQKVILGKVKETSTM